MKRDVIKLICRYQSNLGISWLVSDIHYRGKDQEKCLPTVVSTVQCHECVFSD